MNEIPDSVAVQREHTRSISDGNSPLGQYPNRQMLRPAPDHRTLD